MRVAGVVPVLTAAAVLEQNIGQERTAFPGTECSIGRDTDGPGQAQTSAQNERRLHARRRRPAPVTEGHPYLSRFPAVADPGAGWRSGHGGMACWAFRASR